MDDIFSLGTCINSNYKQQPNDTGTKWGEKAEQRNKKQKVEGYPPHPSSRSAQARERIDRTFNTF